MEKSGSSITAEDDFVIGFPVTDTFMPSPPGNVSRMSLRHEDTMPADAATAINNKKDIDITGDFKTANTNPNIADIERRISYWEIVIEYINSHGYKN